MKLPQKKVEECPEWIVSFTDMTSLEMAFFIVLMSFSTPRMERLSELQGSIQSSFGMMGKSSNLESDITPNPIMQGREWRNPNGPTQMPRFQSIQDHDPNPEIKQLKNQSGEKMDFDRIAEGYRMKVSDAVAYAPGESVMSAQSFQRLAKVARAVKGTPFRVVVLGHVGATDLAVLPNDARVIDLALRRAVGVAMHLADSHGIPFERIAVAGYGPVPGESQPGRVEFILSDDTRFRRAGGEGATP